MKKITFVDCGTVSYSNPVRQSLFTFEDAKAKRSKAIVAAERLKEVLPTVDASGLDLKIPMPGHRDTPEHLHAATKRLEELISSHDAIFLVTDSKEGRWLPAVMAAMHDKLAITVALGFDSFVVQRHGSNASSLGCFFCHDVVAPSNTLSNRSLDQQCTVTRPGLSGIASGIAVELLASTLQHPLRHNAPASKTASLDDCSDDTLLGSVPHQIRGFLTHFCNILLTGQRHSSCPACGDRIRQAANSDLLSFVVNACNDPSFIRKASGLPDTQSAVDNTTATVDGFDVVD